MKINLKQYLLYSSVFAVFTEAFFFNFIIDWKLLYLIIFINYFIIITIYKKLKVNKYLNYFLLFAFIHGIISYTVIGIPPNYMFSQLIGVAIVGVYYYNFVQLYEMEEIVDVFLKMSVFVAIIGYPMYFLGINFNTYNDPRFYSILKEPAHYVIIVLPACYYYFNTKKYVTFLIILGTLILSNSSLGYIGCALIFILPNLNKKRFLYLAATIPFVIISFIYTYNEFDFFKLRVDDTVENLKVINTGKFKEETNLSSYVMLANMYIMKENVIDHPLGSGIGSHHYMHTEKYLKTLRPPEYLRNQNRHTDNSFDANSLFNRVCSEFGIIGFILIIISFFYFFKSFKSTETLFAQGIVIYFILKLFRDGHYFPPEFFFFIWIFYFSLKNRKEANLPN